MAELIETQNLTNEGPNTAFTAEYALPAGSNRVLVVTVGTNSSANAGHDPGDLDSYEIQYGGVTVPFQGDVVAELQIGMLGVLPLEGQSFADNNLTITWGGNERNVCVRVAVFGGVPQDTANFNIYVGDSENGESITLPALNVPLQGDLVYGVGFTGLGTPTINDENYEALLPDAISDAFHMRSYYSIQAEGAQSLTWTHPPGSFWITALAVVLPAGTPPSPAEEFNCDCEQVTTYKTLAQLRTEFMVGVGYAAQAANPPPGMASLANFYLDQAQQFLYLRPGIANRIQRFFRWDMVPGLRYYGIAEGTSGCDGKTLDPLKVSWVGFEDLNRTWVPLIEGIPPEFYTRVQTAPGWPSHYEIRSCIEVFPAPQAAYTLWVKGFFGLAPFAADVDRATIDDRAVLWMAVGMYREDTNKPGADRFKNMALQRLKDIVAGEHNTARFVPHPGGPMPPTVPPRFLPLGGEPS